MDSTVSELHNIVKEAVGEETVERKIKVLEEFWKRFEKSIPRLIELAPEVRRQKDALLVSTIPRVRRIARAFRWGIGIEDALIFNAMIMFASDWLKPEALGTAADYLAELIEILYHRQPVEIDESPLDTVKKLTTKASRVMYAIASLAAKVITSGADASFILSILNPYRVMATPISWMFFNSLYQMAVSKSVFMIRGNRVIVAAELGAGKTTLTTWSLLIPLLASGFDIDTAMKYVKEFHVNTIEDTLAILYIATTYAIEHGKIIPMAVIDDAAVIMSKYAGAPTYAGRRELMRARKLVEEMQIGREGIGFLLFNTTDPDILLKGIRQTVKNVIIGITVITPEIMSRYYFPSIAPFTATVWFMVKRDISVPRLYPNNLVRMLAQQAVQSGIRNVKGVVYAVTATMHPPLYTPSKVYNELEENKLKLRALLIGRMAKEFVKKEEEEKVEEEEISEEDIISEALSKELE